jgi:hypothetical protein
MTVEVQRLHAAVVVAVHDRAALERLCRYGARPAFAHERLAWTADGRIAYKLKRPWPDGRTHLVMEPIAFLRRLVGIIPPPPRHLVRYSGIVGPASKHRQALRALVPADPTQPDGGALRAPAATREHSVSRAPAPLGRPPAPRVRRRRAPVPLRRAPQRRRHRHRHRARPLPARRPRPRHRTRHLRTRARTTPTRPPLGRRRVGAPSDRASSAHTDPDVAALTHVSSSQEPHIPDLPPPLARPPSRNRA